MKAYFISGLAADRRVFKHIKLPDGFEVVHLEWIQPLKNESLESYALRLAEKIDTSGKFVLVGLSMGGMIAAEIAKKYQPIITIIISSAATRNQFPLRFKIASRLRLYKLVPSSLLKSASMMKHHFSAEGPEDKKILKDVIRDSDPSFIRWALGAILKWKNEDAPSPLWHIHGTKDEVLPFRSAKPTHVIRGGGHLMIMSKAGELNHILRTLSLT